MPELRLDAGVEAGIDSWGVIEVDKQGRLQSVNHRQDRDAGFSLASCLATAAFSSGQLQQGVSPRDGLTFPNWLKFVADWGRTETSPRSLKWLRTSSS